jgi:hypothetical protein
MRPLIAPVQPLFHLLPEVALRVAAEPAARFAGGVAE